MPLNELDNPPQPTTDWLPLDHSLLGEARPKPPAFPLHLLPGRWRTWVEDSSRVFGSGHYPTAALVGVAAAGRGAGVAGRSSGKSAAFARVRALLEHVQPCGEREDRGERVAPEILVEAGLD